MDACTEGIPIKFGLPIMGKFLFDLTNANLLASYWTGLSHKKRVRKNHASLRNNGPPGEDGALEIKTLNCV